MKVHDVLIGTTSRGTIISADISIGEHIYSTSNSFFAVTFTEIKPHKTTEDTPVRLLKDAYNFKVVNSTTGYYVANTPIFFEILDIGQLDIKNIIQPIDSDFVNWLIDYWEKYQLKELTQKDKILAINTVRDYVNKSNELEEFLQEWLNKIFNRVGSMMLEEILQKNFGLEGDLYLSEEQVTEDSLLTDNGQLAYSKMIKFLYDLSLVIDFEVNDIVDDLDSLVREV